MTNDPCVLVDSLGLADCFFNIAINNTQNLTDAEAKSAWNEVERLLGLADVGAIFTNAGNADFTVNLKQYPTSNFGYAFADAPPVGSDGGLNWYGVNDAPTTPTNSATVWQNNVEMSAAGMDMGVALGRTMTHEFLHWALNIGKTLGNSPLETGIMAEGALGTFMNGYATLSADQIQVLRQKCKQKRRAGSGGGGSGSNVGYGGGYPGWWGFTWGFVGWVDSIMLEKVTVKMLIL